MPLLLPGKIQTRSQPSRILVVLSVLGVVCLAAAFAARGDGFSLFEIAQPGATTESTVSPTVSRRDDFVFREIELRLQNARSYISDASGEINTIQTRVREVGPHLRDNGYQTLYRRLVEADNRSLTTRRLHTAAQEELIAALALMTQEPGGHDESDPSSR